MRRITRDRRLTPEEAAKYKAIREQVAQELPELIDRHQQRAAAGDQLQGVLEQLKSAREAKISKQKNTSGSSTERLSVNSSVFSSKSVS